MTDPVHILLGAYNGAAHLPAQLESFAAQIHGAWRLTISDDGSTDDTRRIASDFATGREGWVSLIVGPRKGFAENFLSMVRALPDDPGCIAFSDQDDVWAPEKLARGVDALSIVGDDRPALYGSAAWIWGARTDARRKTPTLRRPPSFANALVENFATGNTMMLNPAAARLLRDASRRIGPVFAHDWWAYSLISGAGGRVIYDDEPTILYRQHQGNEIGAGETFWRRQLRNLSVADGRYRRKTGQNLTALSAVTDLLTPESRAMLDAFAAARDASPAPLRLARVMKSGVHRQFRRDSIGFLAAAFLGKV